MWGKGDDTMSELPGEAQLDPPALALIRVAELQAEVVRLRGHKERCEHATLGLLRELLQVRARVHMQASELRQLRQEMQQAAWSPEKEELEVRQSRRYTNKPPFS